MVLMPKSVRIHGIVEYLLRKVESPGLPKNKSKVRLYHLTCYLGMLCEIFLLYHMQKKRQIENIPPCKRF
ncbi:hypothetical protein Lalb_Chr18g0053651 [Lupinus albus]|uniref:Uncharacterized protein n=1 Tax=Lupinus albus TaxID=3870 RepID=A0A6A4P2L3_LUPAL|nr:hypothetical protein Lalb_Chr18g0053651 [Lupinus albus]